jgi:AraC-like DNA-binding protein
MPELVPIQGSDLLTDVLGLLRLQGEFLCRTTLTAPWGLSFPAQDQAHIRFVETGSCWVEVEGEREAIHLLKGELLLLFHGHAHVMRDRPLTSARPLEDFIRANTQVCNTQHAWGGGGAPTEMLCGSFHLEQPKSHPLFRFLPASIHLRADQAHSHPGLEAMLHLMVEEARAALPGVQGIITCLLEAIFIQALRAWASSRPEGASDWLSAMGDRQVFAALDLIHRAPEQPWTVASLSERVGLSRSPFAARFSDKVGMPPLTYLTHWRMRVAAGLLRDRQLGIGQVSQRVGYASESAFSRAFKQQFGISPGAYQRRKGDLTHFRRAG